MHNHDTSNQPPRISVIMIFRNEMSFLCEAIESVIGQSYKDWELLLVDDGSNDGSSELALNYATRHPGQIVYLAHDGHENLGMSASRNMGLGVARGEYVAFLDGDDIYLPRRLETHVRVLDSWAGVDVVQSDLLHWHSWASAKSDDLDYVRPSLSATDRLLAPPLALVALVSLPQLSPGICSLTVRRRLALAIGGFEAQFRSLYEDQVFLTKLYSQCRVYVIEDYLAAYRIHDQSTVEQFRRTRNVKGSPWHAELARFEAWRTHYLQSLPDPLGWFSYILQVARRSRLDRPAGRFGYVGEAIRSGLWRLIETAVPRAFAQLIRRHRRRLLNGRTRSSYEKLCRDWFGEAGEHQVDSQTARSDQLS